MTHNKKDRMKEIIGVATDLIRFESTTDNHEQIFGCMKYVKEHFEDTKAQIDEQIVDGKPSLYVHFGTKTPKLILCGHIDVVPGPDELYNPYEKDGKLWGRGAWDMKGAVACQLVLMREFALQDNPPDVGLMVVSDEETTGASAKAFLNQGYVGEFFITSEPTNFLIGNESKGVCQFRVTFEGIAGHGSRPWQGVNAIQKAIPFIQELTKTFPPIKEGEWTASCNVAAIHGGDVINKIPDRCEVDVDIRYTGADDPNEIIEKVKALADEANVEMIAQGSHMFTDPAHPYIKKLQDSALAVLGKQLEFEQKTGSSDARFWAELGHAAVEFGPDGHGVHAIDENVDVEGLLKYYELLKDYCGRL